MAKRKADSYEAEAAWYKIKNPTYLPMTDPYSLDPHCPLGTVTSSSDRSEYP